MLFYTASPSRTLPLVSLLSLFHMLSARQSNTTMPPSPRWWHAGTPVWASQIHVQRVLHWRTHQFCQHEADLPVHDVFLPHFSFDPSSISIFETTDTDARFHVWYLDCHLPQDLQSEDHTSHQQSRSRLFLRVAQFEEEACEDGLRNII